MSGRELGITTPMKRNTGITVNLAYAESSTYVMCLLDRGRTLVIAAYS